MSKPAAITSPYAPDADDVQRWMEKMIKSLRFVELVVAVVAIITRMRDLNTELTKRLGELRKRRPRSEKLRRIEGQLFFGFEELIPVIDEDEEWAAGQPGEKGSEPKGPRKCQGAPSLIAHEAAKVIA